MSDRSENNETRPKIKYAAVFDLFEDQVHVTTIESVWCDTFDEALYVGKELRDIYGGAYAMDFQVITMVHTPEPIESSMQIP